ncbi:hypothetical protein GCM10023187_32160 [Nibrella viscosa]|uniref:Peptidase C14 caspase domain-containing protein n=1 Tax=Nibrella viscosa TaxID=1084524 RepID=A0ABP8KLW0_9BACT
MRQFVQWIILLSFICLPAVSVRGQAKLHFIVFADTDDPTLSEANRKTFNFLTGRFGPDVAGYAGLSLQMTAYSGSQCQSALFDQTLNKLSVGPDDVVLFYFVGHGWNNRQNEYPSLIFGRANADRATLESNSRNLLTIYEQIRAKQPRLTLVVGEACNKERSDDPPTTSNREAIPMHPTNASPAKYKALFRNYAGGLLLSSCQRNQFSFSDPKGGWMGTSWQETINQLLSDKTPQVPTWETFVKTTVQLTERAALANNQKQNPQYRLDVRQVTPGGNQLVQPGPTKPPGNRLCPPLDSYVNETALAGIREDLPFLKKMDEEISTDNAEEFAETFNRFYTNQKNFYDSLDDMLFYRKADMPEDCRQVFQQETRWVAGKTAEIIRRYKMVVKLSKQPQQLVAQARSELPSLIRRMEEILEKLDK